MEGYGQYKLGARLLVEKIERQSSEITIIWEAIETSERLGFKVISLTGDGASQIESFFSYTRIVLHKMI